MPALRALLVAMLLVACGAAPAPVASPSSEPVVSTESAGSSEPASSSEPVAVEPSAVGGGSGPDGCYTEADLAARAAELAAADEERDRAALARQGLEPLRLPMRSVPVGEIAPPPAELVVVRDGERLLLAGSIGVACGDVGERFFFARAGEWVYFIQRRVVTRRLERPACPPTDGTPPPTRVGLSDGADADLDCVRAPRRARLRGRARGRRRVVPSDADPGRVFAAPRVRRLGPEGDQGAGGPP